jgi:hypothetical protein
MTSSQSISARVSQILGAVDHMEQVVDSAADRLEILEEVIADLRTRAAATKDDIRRG